MFIQPGDKGTGNSTDTLNHLAHPPLVYPGMIIGESTREFELSVNPCGVKKLTNMRSTGADEKVVLSPPRVLNLEETLAYLQSDEKVELTPKSIRLRKAELDESKRKRQKVSSR